MSNIRIFGFNHIVIFESLRDSDPKTGQMLYNNLIKYIDHRFSYVDHTFKVIHSGDQFFRELDTIKAQAESSSKIPFIHIEMHGSKEGLEIKSNEIIPWESFTDKIREINIITGNNILLSLATCCGAHIAGGILPSNPALFRGFMGSWNDISTDDILANFQSFFEFLYNTDDNEPIDFDKATKKLNEGQIGMPKFSFVNSETVFDIVFLDYKKTLKDPIQLTIRITDLREDALKNENVRNKWSPEELDIEIRKKLFEEQPRIYAEMKRKFLMK